MRHFEPSAAPYDLTRATGSPDPLPVLLGSWMTLDEARHYARVTPAELHLAVTQGNIATVLADPCQAGQALVARRDVDRWWRDRVLGGH